MKRETLLGIVIALLVGAFTIEVATRPAAGPNRDTFVTRVGRMVGVWLLMRDPAPVPEPRMMVDAQAAAQNEPPSYAADKHGVAVLNHNHGW